jgi:hypothetical protein
MKTETFLKHLLACTLLTSGCELLDDIADSDSDDDDDAGDTGDGDDGDDDDDDDDDGGEADDGGADETGGDDDGGEDGPADEGGQTDAESGTVTCEEGATVCLDEITVAVCVDGEAIPLDCNDACLELQGVPAIGCFFDDVAGADLCLCDDGSGSGDEGTGEGGA